MRRVISLKDIVAPIIFFSWIAALAVGFWDVYAAFYILSAVFFLFILYRNFGTRDNSVVVRVIDVCIIIILLMETANIFFQPYRSNSILFILKLSTASLVYFTYGYISTDNHNETVKKIIAVYGDLMGIATFVFFLIFRSNVYQEGYYDLLSIKHLYEPFNQLSNDWSVILLIFFAFTFYFFITTKSWWSAGGLMVLLFAILISFSRGAYLSLIVFTISFCVSVTVTGLIKVNQVAKTLFFLLVVFAATFYTFHEPILKTLRGVETVSQRRSIAGRLTIWDNAKTMIKDHPLMGMGSGNFALYFSFYKTKSVDAGNTTRVGNTFLQTIIEKGIIGVVVYGFLFFHVFSIIVKGIKNKPPDKTRSLFLWMVLSLFAGLCVKEFTFSSFFENSTLMLLVFLILTLIRNESPVVYASILAAKFRLISMVPVVLVAVAGLTLYTLQKADALHTQAIISSNQHNHLAALVSLDKAKSLSRKQPVYFIHSAVILERLYSESQRDQVFGQDYEGYLPHISISAKDRIIDQYNLALAGNSKDDRAHHNVGWYYFSKGDFANASRHLKAATELEPTEPVYCVSYGILLDSLAKTRSLADTFFVKALQLSPAIINSVFWKNFSLKNPSRQLRIVHEAKKALESSIGDNVITKAKYASLAMDPFKPDSARMLLEQVNNDMPNLSRAWLNLGILYFNKENIQKAVPCIKRAALLDKNDYKPMLLLAAYFEKIRRYKEAAIYYKLAFEMLIDLKSQYDYKIIKTYGTTATLSTIPWKLWLAVKSDYTILDLCAKLSDINKFAQNDSLVHVYEELGKRIFLSKGDVELGSVPGKQDLK